MKKQHYSFGKIGKLSDALYQMRKDHGDELEEFNIHLTEKIHGTNAAVCYNNNDGIWYQSRKNIITPLDDNQGCAFFCEARKGAFTGIIQSLAVIHNIDLSSNTICLYFEFAGGGIQTNSALTGIDKSAVLFPEFTVINRDEEVKYYTTCSSYQAPKMDIYNLSNYYSSSLICDPSNIAKTNNELISIVEEIEAKSPLGCTFNKENIGEGVVGIIKYKGDTYRFKAKGDKHSATKVTKLKPVNEEQEQIIRNFTNGNACPAWRLEQMYEETFDIKNGGEATMKDTGRFLKAVLDDIVKEEMSLMVELGVDVKSCQRAVFKTSRKWFFEQLEKRI